uniref:TACO1/YebC-like N-terminal domain-containing protein n=2 Tax=Timema TaxID=61471 RepID=A0A7R9NX84_9NEOP|nr:unnamed protein product [Timema bartmani]CAD7459614.1 unnamed protein product [Timema tahoe]
MWAWKLSFLSYVTPKYLVVLLHLIAWRSIFSEGFLRSVPLNNISSTKATNPTIPGSASISSNTKGNGTNPDFNVQLSQAIEQAKKNSMPRATVENAINQAKRRRPRRPPVDANSQPGPYTEQQPGSSTAPSSAPLTFIRPCDEETWQRLAPDCTYEYIAADDDITVWGTHDNADIIREQQDSSNEEGEEEMEEEPEDIPTTKDVLKAGDVYSRAIKRQGTSEELWFQFYNTSKLQSKQSFLELRGPAGSIFIVSVLSDNTPGVKNELNSIVRKSNM